MEVSKLKLILFSIPGLYFERLAHSEDKLQEFRLETTTRSFLNLKISRLITENLWDTAADPIVSHGIWKLFGQKAPILRVSLRQPECMSADL